MKESTTIKLAGYGLLAIAGLSSESAQAAVVTSTSVGFTPFTIMGGQSLVINFGGAVGSPFQVNGIAATFTYSSVVYNNTSFVLQTGGDGSNRQFIGSNDPYRLGTNYVISAARTFDYVATADPDNTTNDIAGDAGEWNGVQGSIVEGFLGFRFESPALDSGFHYGFLDIVYDNTPSSDSGALTVRGWAYESDADTNITTFATGPAVVPETSSLMLAGLGMLACGGAGLRALRAQKASAAAPLQA